MSKLLEMGIGGETIFNPHKCPERASIVKEALNHQMDKVTYSVDVNFLPQLLWFLLNGSTYQVAMVAGMGLFIVW